MGELAERFLEEYVPVRCKPATAHSYRGSITRHVLPRLGARRVTDMTRGDVAALHHGMHALPGSHRAFGSGSTG